MTTADYEQCAELLATYDDLHLGLVEAFPGRFSLDAAQAVAGAEHETLRPLHVDDRSTQSRYRIFEVVRTFAQDRLHDRGEDAEVHDCLVAWCLEALAAPVTQRRPISTPSSGSYRPSGPP